MDEHWMYQNGHERLTRTSWDNNWDNYADLTNVAQSVGASMIGEDQVDSAQGVPLRQGDPGPRLDLRQRRLHVAVFERSLELRRQPGSRLPKRRQVPAVALEFGSATSRAGT
jgi:hypothetical protein